jgi:hypothetical protein
MSSYNLSGRRRWLACLLSAACLAFPANVVDAALLAYEPFEFGDVAVPSEGQYALGNESIGVNPLGGQNPIIGPTPFYAGAWIQSGGDAQAVKALPSLGYPNFPVGIGGLVSETIQFDCCSFGRSGREIAGGLGGPLEDRVIYESFLIDFGGQGSDDPSKFGKRGHELWNGGIGDAFLAVDLFVNSFSGANELTLGVTTPSGSQSALVSGGGLTLQAMAGVHLVVMKYDFNPVAADVVSVFFDPASAVESLTPDAQISVAASDLRITHQGAITNFTFSGGGHIPAAIDEIRWGDGYREVTLLDIPEPSTLAMLSVVLVGGVWRRMGRRIA